MRPAKGSAMVLKTKRESGWLSSYLRSMRSPCPLGSLKPTCECSSGCGKTSAMKVSGLAVPTLRRGNHEDGENLFGDDGFAHSGDQVFNGNGSFAKEFFHQFVVALSHHLYQFFVG